MIRLILSIGVLTAAFTPMTGRAQTVAERMLEAEAVYTEPYSRIRGIRELLDGTILVADQREVAVYRVASPNASREKVGREGGGPLEHRAPVGLTEFGADSSLLVDVMNSRIAVLGPDGAIKSTFANRQFGYRMGGTRGDGNGNVYFDHRISASGDEGRQVFRWHRPLDRLDTLTILAPSERFTDDGRTWPVPWSAGDTWAVGTDGRVAVVRRNPYRIEFIDSDGTVRQLPPVNYEPIRVQRADRDAWNERPGIAVVGMGNARPRLPSNWPFPEHFPPFGFRAANITPDGLLWVERRQPQGETRPLFDVFDDNGLLRERVRLPAGREVVGFGNGTVYATREDEDGLLWLERYWY